ncbi:hypothetical protein FQR65_LT11766 [Abscondita terminalis]|nr:hypothetical protein FQR65_LT11766 [Abscondita terminalis]
MRARSVTFVTARKHSEGTDEGYRRVQPQQSCSLVCENFPNLPIDCADNCKAYLPVCINSYNAVKKDAPDCLVECNARVYKYIFLTGKEVLFRQCRTKCLNATCLYSCFPYQNEYPQCFNEKYGNFTNCSHCIAKELETIVSIAHLEVIVFT